jgi:coenzyme PQQ precursor peptide PqqA
VASGIINSRDEQRAGQLSVFTKEIAMTKVWTRPDFEEVSLGCEINCYAPAE